jgi:hypothetical protein
VNIRPLLAAVVAFALLGAAPKPKLDPAPRSAQTQTLLTFLTAMRDGRYPAAFSLLSDEGKAYYRTAANFQSVYDADAYRIEKFSILGARGDATIGRVYFVRETAKFRDHSHDLDADVTVTVPVAVIPIKGGWRIKDPGHPWRAFASTASASANGLTVTVKKLSFFERRIEAVVTFTNLGSSFVTILPYGKSVLRDNQGTIFRIIETKDWSLTDKTLFEGLRLAPNAEYTGALAFESDRLDDTPRTFTLTIAPALTEGGDAPFSLDVTGIAAAAR